MVKTIKKHLQKNKTLKISKKKSQKGGEDENGVKEIVTLDNVKNKLNLSLTKLQELNNNQNNVTLKDINEKNLLVSFNETFITYLKNNFNKNSNSINDQSLFSDGKLNELNYSRLLNGQLGNTEWPTDEQKQDMMQSLQPKIIGNQQTKLSAQPIPANTSMSNSEMTKKKNSKLNKLSKIKKKEYIKNLKKQKEELINMSKDNVNINNNNNNLNNKTYYNKYLINPLKEALNTANNLLFLYNNTNNNTNNKKKNLYTTIKNAKNNIDILENIINNLENKINNLENKSKININNLEKKSKIKINNLVKKSKDTINEIIGIIDNVLKIINNNNGNNSNSNSNSNGNNSNSNSNSNSNNNNNNNNSNNNH